MRFTETVILSIIHKRISEAVQTQKWPETPEVIDFFFLKLTERLVILTTINYIMKKTPQITEDQRYDKL